MKHSNIVGKLVELLDGLWVFVPLWALLRCKLEMSPSDERGDVAEKVVVVARFVAAAVALGYIIYGKVVAAANGINL
jgi:hypothetical protein